MVAPAGTPKDVVAKLNAKVKKAMTPEFRAELTKINLIPVGDTSDEFTAFVKADSATYANIVKQAGIQPQ